MMDLVTEISPVVGKTAACDALAVPRATYYRCSSSATGSRQAKPRPPSHRALLPQEVDEVLAVLQSERFVDVAPAEVYATLLDEGIRLCSVRSMYRYLAAAGQVHERRNQLVHPSYAKPELLATAPNQVWSWDITKLRAAQKWTYYYLYVLLDIYSRYVVGWMLAHREAGELAARLVEETCKKQDIERDQLTVHADRGSAPKSKSLAQMFTDLGVDASFSRPRVSNDNPFSEAHFKTYKYQPEYPNRFGSYEHALSYSRSFFDWYCNRHRHSGIAMLTPADVHYGRAADVLAERQRVLDTAYAAHPERFVGGRPVVPALPQEVWINPPEDKTRSEIKLQ
jgi:putative transposase